MHIPTFPIMAGGVHRLTYLDLGPGGATNIAIMAARFGIPVTCLGEMGDDVLSQVILDGQEKEGIITDSIMIIPGTTTPMAGLVVDPQAEPAYFAFAGQELELDSLPEVWRP